MQTDVRIDITNRIQFCKRSVIILFFLIFSGISFSANVSAEKTGSIEVRIPIEGIQYSIYRIGTYSASEGYVLDSKYAAFNVNINETGGAMTLELYIKCAQFAPDKTAVSDSEGKAVFENLPLGVYLVSGQTTSIGEVFYMPFASLASIPQTVNEEIVYDVTVETKIGASLSISPDEIKVVKIWKDDMEQLRPTSVTVVLLQDGIPAEGIEDAEVVLSQENDWTYSWIIGDTSSSWSVVEKDIPDGYFVTIETSEETNNHYVTSNVVIINKSGGNVAAETNEETEEETEISTEKSTEGSSTGGSSSGGSSTGGSSTGGSSSGGTAAQTAKIPQTGQLWWPVGILAVSGLFFILVGLLIRRSNE